MQYIQAKDLKPGYRLVANSNSCQVLEVVLGKHHVAIVTDGITRIREHDLLHELLVETRIDYIEADFVYGNTGYKVIAAPSDASGSTVLVTRSIPTF